MEEKVFQCSTDELEKAVEDGANIYDVFEMLFGEKSLTVGGITRVNKEED